MEVLSANICPSFWTQVFPRNCPEAATKVVVWKRYKNFLKLHSDLKQRHEDLHLKVPFPPFPKAKFFGRWVLSLPLDRKSPSNNTVVCCFGCHRFEEEVVEQRRQAALVFLEFVADIPVLFLSQPFVKFFEVSTSLLKLDLIHYISVLCSKYHLIPI